MRSATSNTALASIHWVGSKELRPPWRRYKPTICVDSVPELNMTSTFWDIVVREIAPASNDRTFNMTFQFASFRAPHDLLAAGMNFGLYEGPGVCVWRGTINDALIAPRNPDAWYGNDRNA